MGKTEIYTGIAALLAALIWGVLKRRGKRDFPKAGVAGAVPNAAVADGIPVEVSQCDSVEKPRNSRPTDVFLEGNFRRLPFLPEEVGAAGLADQFDVDMDQILHDESWEWLTDETTVVPLQPREPEGEEALVDEFSEGDFQPEEVDDAGACQLRLADNPDSPIADETYVPLRPREPESGIGEETLVEDFLEGDIMRSLFQPEDQLRVAELMELSNRFNQALESIYAEGLLERDEDRHKIPKFLKALSISILKCEIIIQDLTKDNLENDNIGMSIMELVQHSNEAGAIKMKDLLGDLPDNGDMESLNAALIALLDEVKTLRCRVGNLLEINAEFDRFIDSI